MARLLVEGEAFEALSSTALLEAEYERIVLAQASGIFPGFIVVPFKPTVHYEGVPKQPDLALIAPDYSIWWVGEVELSNHSLRGHVLPQVEVLARGRYGVSHAQWLADRNPNLDIAALQAMMLGQQPRVVVIVNAPCPTWTQALAHEGAVVAIAELFRSSRNRLIVRRNGADIELMDDVVSVCRVDTGMRRMLQVDSPAQLVGLAEPLLIEIADGVSAWRLIQLADRVWLSPERGSPFPQDNQIFQLVRTHERRLRLEPYTEPRRRP